MTNKIKKGLAIALAIGTMATMCTGCGHNDPPPTEPFVPPVTAPAPTVPPLTEAPTEPVETVAPVIKPTNPEPAKPTLDEKYVKVKDSMFVNKTTKLYEFDNVNSSTIATVDFQDKLNRIGYSDDGWTAIEYLGETVYMESKYLSRVKPADYKTMYATTEVNMRSRADINSSVVRKVSKGAEVVVMDSSNRWSHVKVDGKEGYIYDQYLSSRKPSDSNNNKNNNNDNKPVAPPVSFQKVNDTVYAKDDVNVRTGPGVDYRLVGKLQKNESVKRTAKGSNGWFKVMFNGYEYCVAGNYLTTEKPKDADKPTFANDEKVKFKEVNEMVYATTDVNVRSGPAVGYKQIGVLKTTKGAKRIGIGDNGWSKVVLDGQECFIATKYLTTKNPYPNKPDVKPDHEHTYKMEVHEPTCTEKGYTTFTCTICKYTYNGDYVDAKGHTWGEWEVVKKPTADKKGQERRQCSVCKVVQNRDIDPIGHTHVYEETVIPPTCTEKGYTLHKCTKCDDQYKDTYVDSLGGHKWSEWTVDKAATDKEVGSKSRHCTREGCKATETAEIPVVKCEHTYTEKVVAPTCEADGYTLHKCSKCGDEFKDNIVKAKGHEYEVNTVEAPTCDRHGATYYKCKHCDHGYWGDDKPALGHDWSEWKVTKEATTEAEGIETRTCSRCPKTETRPIPKKPAESGTDTKK